MRVVYKEGVEDSVGWVVGIPKELKRLGVFTGWKYDDYKGRFILFPNEHANNAMFISLAILLKNFDELLYI